MSAKIFKLIRKYAKLRGLSYKKCKVVYLIASPEDQKKYLKEMEMAPYNDPILNIHDKFTGKTVVVDPREVLKKKKVVKN